MNPIKILHEVADLTTVGNGRFNGPVQGGKSKSELQMSNIKVEAPSPSSGVIEYFLENFLSHSWTNESEISKLEAAAACVGKNARLMSLYAGGRPANGGEATIFIFAVMTSIGCGPTPENCPSYRL